jgi:predicted RNA binding protein YcfA (HicA-like mRNA interferase family)
MPRPPVITGKTACKVFAKVGYQWCRTRGSHHILKHPTNPNRLSIPVHAGETLGIGLLADQIEKANMTVEQLLNCSILSWSVNLVGYSAVFLA